MKDVKTTIVLELTQQEADTLVLLANSGAGNLKVIHDIGRAIEQADPKSVTRQFKAWDNGGSPHADLSAFSKASEALA